MGDTVVQSLLSCICLIRETIKSSRSKTGPGNWAWSNAERLLDWFLLGASLFTLCLVTPQTVPLALRGLPVSPSL